MSREIPRESSDRPGELPEPPGDGMTLKVDDSKIVCGYANFIRVTGTPEEMVVDFGLHAQVSGGPAQPVLLGQRTVMNFFTAKRLLAALHMTIERHEAAFGVLETDVQKRAQAPRR
jgi:hypothetical protein